MENPAIGELFVVVAALGPLEAGTSFGRREWPAHVTLASNFFLTESLEQVVSAVSKICDGLGPIAITFTHRAMFGPHRDIPVRLVESTQVCELHQRLADLLQDLPGFRASEPEHWRAGYRPHMTEVPDAEFEKGDRAQLAYLAVATLTKRDATIVGTLTLW
ncbi:2'-5' RNA ligase family protein [Microbacterium trichothecenolyticum]|uniref:2'-5' RNA ligase family protein n=1 Tax=Microbacterium trichothecenolyticum TaxID=69370 RepID=UPI0035BE856B